ncbi:MAG: hypothetical protein ACI9YH_001036 [Colwellia sp.]|jgi:hypothetical protein
MNKRIKALFIFLLSNLLVTGVGVATENALAIKHHFIAVDNGNNQLLEVDQFTGLTRTAKMPTTARDINRLAENLYLVSLADGFAIFNAKSWKITQRVLLGKGIDSAYPLANNEVLIVSNRPSSRLLRVNLSGTVLNEYNIANIHDLRLARVDQQGHYLFTSTKPFRAISFDPETEQLTEFALQGKGYELIKRDGLFYATTGLTRTVDVHHANGQLISSYGGVKDHPDARLKWFSGFSLLADKSVVVANWLGHKQQGTGPHLVQFDRNNKLIWQWEDHTLAAEITNFILLK